MDKSTLLSTALVVALAVIFQDDVANMLHPIGNSIVLPDELLRATSNLVCDVQEKTMGLFFNMPKVKPTMDKYDYVIVGAGSSGGVLASRLSEDPSVSVLVIEAGPTDKHLFVDMPLASPFLQGTERDWALQIEPTEFACQGMDCTKDEQHAGKTGCCRWPMGRGLGGGSTINYMAYVRGNPEDFNEWDRMGATGWNYSAVLPYFKKSENNKVFRFSSFHGTDGPLDVNDPRERNPITAAFVDGCKDVGLEDNPDYNGEHQEGCSRLQFTTRDSERWSVSKAFLWPALRSRTNLEVVALADVLKVELDCQKGKKCRASGVTLRDRTGAVTTVQAGKEVILTASAVMTPKLMMLSGIGPKAELERHGIATKVELPGVGQNLQDHNFFVMIFNGTKPVSYRKRDATSVSGLANWLLRRRGVLTSCLLEGTMFTRTRHNLTVPDLQIHVVSSPGSPEDLKNFGLNEQMAKFFRMNDDEHGFVLLPTLLHQGKTGSIQLRSADPLAAPVVNAAYLQHPDDIKTYLAGIKLALKIAQSASMREFTDGTLRINWEECPQTRCGCPNKDLAATPDSFWECMVRTVVSTVYHPAGTAKMGRADDPMAVLDPELRVRGVDNLRVCDASAWPMVISGNTNAPAIMVAERAADIIKAGNRR